MKKILLSTAALVGVAFAAAPAMAQVDVTVGGHTKNYLGWSDQDNNAGTRDTKSFDMLRESELHFNAEGTADNGLTYGFHVEAEVDGGDSFTVEESYLYLSSSLGRVNLGSEDGANYLLQVAAPSADANVDGLRQYINPINYTNTGLAGTVTRVDYANDATAQAEKITYLSPNWNGFQFGVSYTPSVGAGNSVGTAGFALQAPNGVVAAGPTFVADALAGLDDAYEGALRYEGTFNNVGFAVGGGYTHIDQEARGALVDDVAQWNLGADLDIGAFGLGAVYTQTDNVGGIKNLDSDTWVVGADYTTGPFQFGVSYLTNEVDLVGPGDIETDRYTAGVVYTVTQGLTLRGSISHIEHDLPAATGRDIDGTSVLGGIQFNF